MVRSLRDGLSSATPMEPQASPPEASIPSAWHPIEYENCYPEDEEFSAFDRIPLSFHHAAEWLLSELPRAAEHMCCECDVEEGVDSYWEKPVSIIRFSTMGWSGAESIMGLIERRFDLNHFMVSWKRGGHYVFEVPHRYLASADRNPEGQDPQGLGAKHESAVAESETPNPPHPSPSNPSGEL